MASRVVGALDIGSYSVKMAIAQRKEEGDILEVLGLVEEHCSGVRKGAVVNPEKVGQTILSLKKRVENLNSQPVKEVFVNMGGHHIFVVPSHGIVAVSRADGQISQEDVERVLQAAQAFSLPSNKEILDIFPRQFIVDGEPHMKEVIGMKGVRLEVDVLAICGFSPFVENVADAAESAELRVADIIPSPLASAEAVLHAQQKELGVAVVDMGAGTTGLSVFEEGDLTHIAIFPVGSENITNDIAIGLRTDHDIAEKIKKEYGNCISLKGRKTEKVELSQGEFLSFSQKFLTHIIESRMREILQFVQKELKKLGKHANLPAGIVLTGGGAKISKIVEFAKKELKLPVRIGSLHGMTNPYDDPAFFCVLGLIARGAALQGEAKNLEGTSFLFLRKIKKILKVFIP